MSWTKTSIILALLCALAASALSAPAASAGTTEFTCIEGAGTANTNSDCEPGSTGKFGHVPISEKTTTVADKITNPILEGKLFGASVKLEATGLECIECTSENKEVGGVMEFTGSGGRIKFTGVTAVGLPKCNVNGGSITTEKGKFTTTVSSGATVEPEVGTKLAVFNITGEGCTIAGLNITVTGKAAVSHVGARLIINITKASEELKLEGEKASIKGEGTVTTGPIPSGPLHAVSLTTA